MTSTQDSTPTIETIAAELAAQAIDVGATAEIFTDGWDLYPADYAYAREALGRELSARDARELCAAYERYVRAKSEAEACAELIA